jgi:hypothetical protein
MGRDGEWRERHVRCDCLRVLRGDALGLCVGDDEVEEVLEDGSGWAWGVGIEEELGGL